MGLALRPIACSSFCIECFVAFRFAYALSIYQTVELAMFVILRETPPSIPVRCCTQTIFRLSLPVNTLLYHFLLFWMLCVRISASTNALHASQPQCLGAKNDQNIDLAPRKRKHILLPISDWSPPVASESHCTWPRGLASGHWILASFSNDDVVLCVWRYLVFS